MSRSYNGLDLETEFSELLGDTSTSFKSRVTGWINDIHLDMMSRHDWNFLKVKGTKLLVASQEEQQLNVPEPGAATVALAAGGTLTDGSTYNVYITFVESSTGYETRAGTVSADITTTTGNQTIDVTAIPVSTEGLVTSRKVYLQKDGGDILFHQEIADNVTTIATITADTASLIEAPDYIGIRRIDGNPFIESSSQLQYRDIDQLRLLFQGTFSTGTPDLWSPLSESKILLYPLAASALILSFYYIKLPPRIYASADSQPFAPIYLKQVLKAGVIAMGYEYRDRDGQQEKRLNYETLLSNAISDVGSPKRVAARVRDVVGGSDGFEI